MRHLVVNNTNHLRVSNSVRWDKCRRKIISSTTPVIRDIIVLTVSSVKLLNNVVVGMEKTMIETKQERRICDECGGAAMHEVKYINGESFYMKCSSCLSESGRQPSKDIGAKNKEALDSFFTQFI